MAMALHEAKGTTGEISNGSQFVAVNPACVIVADRLLAHCQGTVEAGLQFGV
jgi:hypothetical protein